MKHVFIRTANGVGRNEGWRYFLGCLLSFGAGQIIGAVPLLIVVVISAGVNITPEIMTNPAALGIDKNLFLVLALLPFAVSFFSLWLYVRLVHKKSFRLLFTPFTKFRWNYFFGAGLLWFLLLAITEGISYLSEPGNYVFQFEAARFIPLLLISLTLLFIQTTYEEVLFRGYGMQWLGKYFENSWVPLIITSVVFGLMHIANPEVKEYGYEILLSYIAMGLGMGIITLMSGSLEMAMGMHFVNNFFSATVFTFEKSTLQTDALFRIRTLDYDMSSQLFLIVSLAVFIIGLKYIYKLDFNINKSHV